MVQLPKQPTMPKVSHARLLLIRIGHCRVASATIPPTMLLVENGLLVKLEALITFALSKLQYCAESYSSPLSGPHLSIMGSFGYHHNFYHFDIMNSTAGNTFLAVKLDTIGQESSDVLILICLFCI